MPVSAFRWTVLAGLKASVHSQGRHSDMTAYFKWVPVCSAACNDESSARAWPQGQEGVCAQAHVPAHTCLCCDSDEDLLARQRIVMPGHLRGFANAAR